MLNSQIKTKGFKKHCQQIGYLCTLVFFLFTCNLSFSQTPTSNNQPINQTANPMKNTLANQLLSNGQYLGQATMRWFGLKIYDAQLWAEKPPAQFNYRTDAHLLELTYAHDFESEKIAEKSREEIEKQGVGTTEVLNMWQKKLSALIPSIKKGNQLTALYKPGKGLVLFKNGQTVGELNDPELAIAFMGIWLDPRSSEPALREKLIGLKP